MSSLFPDMQNQETGVIELVYSSDVGMKALDVAEAIRGMQAMLKEAGALEGLKDFEVFVYPIEQGSQKIIFKYVKKTGAVIVYIGGVFGFFTGGLDLIERFGANTAYHQPQEVINAASNAKILELCKNKNFIEGSKKIVEPISSEVKVSVRYKDTNQEVEITCDSKEKFEETLSENEDMILPDWQNGAPVSIVGELTRINKGYNDIGFKYKDMTLVVKPLSPEEKVSAYHALLDEEQVFLQGIVIRNSYFEKPEIKFERLEKFRESISLVNEES